jgi:hypothetical protein
MRTTPKYEGKCISSNGGHSEVGGGGKRRRPKGSKSKAVTFGAEAMPDNDLVTCFRYEFRV